jgi:alkaline phosphatase
MAEQVDFDNSVQAVMDWIDDESNGSSWGNTLLIVTADHETGGIWGPGTVLDDGGTPSDGSNGGTHLDDTINDEWQKIVDNGEGNMPGFEYTTGGHTNVLVPLWAKGKGSQLFKNEIAGNDAMADAFWSESQGWKWKGDYVDNTAVFRVMDGAMTHPNGQAKAQANAHVWALYGEETGGKRNSARDKVPGSAGLDLLLFARE